VADQAGVVLEQLLEEVGPPAAPSEQDGGAPPAGTGESGAGRLG
jgi:hypothetical protein